MNRFEKRAVAFGVALFAFVTMWTAVAYSAPQREGVTPDLIQDAIGILEFNRDETQWTKSGKPRVDAIERLLEADISAADRDMAWDLYRAPVVQAVPVDVSEFQARIAGLENQIRDYQASINDLREHLQASRLRAGKAESRIEEAERRGAVAEAHYQGLIDAAAADRRATARLKEEAQSVLAQAEARERGAGPSSSRDCRKAITARILDADTTWAGNLKVEKEDLKAVRAACLEGA